MAYDSALAVFSPDGRLIQVENAQKASDQGNLIVFSCTDTAISITFDQRIIDHMRIEPLIKPYIVDAEQNIWLAYSGLRPDALDIIDKARLFTHRHRYLYMTNIRLHQLASALARYMQKYTITRGFRPFGVKVVLFGIEDIARAFVVGPDGNYVEYRASAIGQKADKAVQFLENNMKEEDCVWNTVAAVMNVAQNDFSKTVTYLINKMGLRIVESQSIKI